MLMRFTVLRTLIFAEAGAKDGGQTLLEYVLVMSLVSVAFVGALALIAGDLGTLYTTVAGSF